MTLVTPLGAMETATCISSDASSKPSPDVEPVCERFTMVVAPYPSSVPVSSANEIRSESR
jgi:hypothetical protein